MFPLYSVYAHLFNDAILRFAASGLDLKVSNDLEWDLQRTESERLLETKKLKSFGMENVQERKLNLADTEGMFLLMAIGYVVAGSVLFSEIVGGCAKSCRAFMRRSSVSDGSRRGSTFSAGQPDESRTFTDKLKHKIRRRLRPTSKHHESNIQSENVEPNKEGKCAAISIPEIYPKLDDCEKVDKPEKMDEPEKWKGITSFCMIKRIMLMRKQRKEQKKATQKEMSIEKSDVATEQQPNHLNIEIEDRVEVDEGAGGVRNITVENVKCGETGDVISFNGSSSMCSDSHAIKEETEVEVNQLSVDSDRENNPSKEFGELV